MPAGIHRIHEELISIEEYQLKFIIHVTLRKILFTSDHMRYAVYSLKNVETQRNRTPPELSHWLTV